MFLFRWATAGWAKVVLFGECLPPLGLCLAIGRPGPSRMRVLSRPFAGTLYCAPLRGCSCRAAATLCQRFTGCLSRPLMWLECLHRSCLQVGSYGFVIVPTSFCVRPVAPAPWVHDLCLFGVSVDPFGFWGRCVRWSCPQP